MNKIYCSCFLQSPEGTMVVSAAADETLRFWKVFMGHDSLSKSKEKTHHHNGALSLRLTNIR